MYIKNGRSMESTAVSLPRDGSSRTLVNAMEKKARYVYWQHEDMWLGYLEEFSDYWTQGRTLEELQENLRDLYNELTGGEIPSVSRVAELQLTSRSHP